MFLCARAATSDDVEIMLHLCRPASLFGPEAREAELRLWERIWSLATVEGVVMEDLNHRDTPAAVGFMAVASMTPEMHDHLVRPGGPDLVPGFADALEGGDFPPLTESVVGQANAGEGLDKIFLWVGYESDGQPTAATVSLRSRVVAAYNDLYAGNRVHRVTVESSDERLLHRFTGYGYKVLREQDGKTVMSMNQEDALAGAEISSQRLFSYDPPVLGFTAAQRDILLLARQGFTDQEVAAALGKSADSVKKRWSGIYARFAQVFPGRLPSAGDGSRGMEKRRTLLAYLRDRPEELRPYGP